MPLQDYGASGASEQVGDGHTDEQPCSSWLPRFLVGWIACFLVFSFGIALPAIPQPYEINTVMCPHWTAPPKRLDGNCAAHNSSDDGTVSNKYACPEGLIVKGVSDAVNSIGGVLLGKLWGVLSDHYGRRPFLILNALAYLTCSMCLYFAQGWSLFIISQVASGFFAPGAFLFTSYVIDVVPEEKRGPMLGVLIGGIGLAFGAGISIGGAVYASAGRTVFLVSAIGCAVAALLAAFMSDPHGVERTAQIDWPKANPITAILTFFSPDRPRTLRAALPFKILVVYAFCTFTSAIINYLAWRWQFGSGRAGVAYGMMGISVLVSAPGCFRLFKSDANVLQACCIVMLIGFVAAGAGECPDTFVIGIALTGLALAQPAQPALSSFFSKLAPVDQQGEMQANLSVLANAVNALAALFVAWVFVASQQGHVAAGSVMFIAAAVLVVALFDFRFRVLKIQDEEGSSEKLLPNPSV